MKLVEVAPNDRGFFVLVTIRQKNNAPEMLKGIPTGL